MLPVESEIINILINLPKIITFVLIDYTSSANEIAENIQRMAKFLFYLYSHITSEDIPGKI
jgi:hypothetical protein